MNSFSVRAIGYLARNPEPVARKGHEVSARFCLTGDDIAAEEDGHTMRVVVTSVWFTAAGVIARDILRKARKGDQLILEARVSAHRCAGKQHQDQQQQQGYEFMVTGVRFGARGRDGSPAQARKADPPALLSGAEAAEQTAELRRVRPP
jgi:single-stranded DNA-binding protein